MKLLITQQATTSTQQIWRP